jgi:hypothetical protein
MYNMKINILGMKTSLECIVISMIIGAILCCSLLCGASRVSAREGMQILGSNVDYVMGKGVPGNQWTKNPPAMQAKYETNQGPEVPLPEGQMFFLANNAFKPECCSPASPLAYSSSTGCACVTKEQIDYINKRGGNRNHCGGGF